MDIENLKLVPSYREILTPTHSERSPTSSKLSAVEEWLKENPHKRMENQVNGGIKRAAQASIFTASKNLSPKARKAFIAKAKAEDKEARKILKQQDEAARLQLIANKKQVVIDRRYARQSILESGGMIKLVKDKAVLPKLITDIDYLRKKKKMQIVLATHFNSKDNYYIVDTFKRWQPIEKGDLLETNMSMKGVKEKLLAAIRTEKLISVDSFKYSMQNTMIAMQTMAMQEGLDIYAIKKGMRAEGWILIPDDADK